MNPQSTHVSAEQIIPKKKKKEKKKGAKKEVTWVLWLSLYEHGHA